MISIDLGPSMPLLHKLLREWSLWESAPTQYRMYDSVNVYGDSLIIAYDSRFNRLFRVTWRRPTYCGTLWEVLDEEFTRLQY